MNNNNNNRHHHRYHHLRTSYTTPFFTLISLICLLSLRCVSADVMTLSTASEFIEFAKNVNKGADHSGTTVLLNADIDFSDNSSAQFEPVGISDTATFAGVFDGQGHVISNLVVNSSSFQYTSLFGSPGN